MQIESNYTALVGAFATVTAEAYLALSAICLATAFLKSFIAIYKTRTGFRTQNALLDHSLSREPGNMRYILS